MEETTHPHVGRRERGWKLSMLLPRMLLHKPARGGKLISQFDEFSAGRWDVLIAASEACDRGAVVDRGDATRRPEDDVKRRAVRALTLVHLGALQWSPGVGRCRGGPWQCTDAQHVARSEETPSPTSVQGTSYRGITEFVPEFPFEKEVSDQFEDITTRCNRGPFGHDIRAFENSRAEAPSSIASAIRLGRFTALQTNGGVRGIVVGDTL